MSEITQTGAFQTAQSTAESASMRQSDCVHQAYLILRCGFAALPVIAGLDKFFHRLTNWDMYLAPNIANLVGQVGLSDHTFMLVVGVVEIVAGLLVALKPRFGAYLVAAWLAGIILNLLLVPG